MLIGSDYRLRIRGTKKTKGIGGSYSLIMRWKEQQMKYIGSEIALVVPADSGSRMAMNCGHMPQNNLVQIRRRAMCNSINATINQLADGVLFYRSPMFPQCLDWYTGNTLYITQIPQWWYQLAQVPDSYPLDFESSGSASMLPVDLLEEIACYLENPSRLVLTHTCAHRYITMGQVRIVNRLADQTYPLARLLNWWGHRVWTRGRMPVLQEPPAPRDDEWLAQLYQRWDDQDARMEAAAYERLPRHIRDELEDAPRYNHEEELHWYNAVNFLEQAQEEARVFGERIPLGVFTGPEGAVQLFYSDDEVIDEDLVESE